MKILFNYKIQGFRIRRAHHHKLWLSRVFSEEGFSEGLINYIFTDNNDILDINRQFLKHNYFTDVITFDYSEKGLRSGEIYISVDSVRSNANIYKVSAILEFRRVMVHGILHLCGYSDSTAPEAIKMREMEDIYLKVYSDEFCI